MTKATLRDYKHIYTSSDSQNLTSTFQVASGDKILLYVYGRKNAAPEVVWNWDYSEITIGGQEGSLLATPIEYSQSNFRWRARVYGFTALTAGTHSVVIKTNSTNTRYGAYICAYKDCDGFGGAGVYGEGSPVGGNNNTRSGSVSVNASLPFSMLSAVAFHKVGYDDPGTLVFTGPVTVTTQFSTSPTPSDGSGFGSALAHGFVGGTGNETIDVESQLVTPGPAIGLGILAVEVKSQGDFKAEFSLGTDMFPVPAPATFQLATTNPEILIGVIHTVQAFWEGNASLHTQQRIIYVLLMFTKGQYWVQPDGSDPQENVVTLQRRRAYLIPR